MNASLVFIFTVVVHIHCALPIGGEYVPPAAPKYVPKQEFDSTAISDLLEVLLPLDDQCDNKGELVWWAYISVSGRKQHIYCKGRKHFLRANILQRNIASIKYIYFRRRIPGSTPYFISDKGFDLNSVKWIVFGDELPLLKEANNKTVPAIATFQVGTYFFSKLKRRLDGLAELFQQQCRIKETLSCKVDIPMKGFDAVVPYTFDCSKLIKEGSINNDDPKNTIHVYDDGWPFTLKYNWKTQSFLSKANRLNRDEAVTYKMQWSFAEIISAENNPHYYKKNISDGIDFVYDRADFEQDLDILRNEVNRAQMERLKRVYLKRLPLSGGIYLGERCFLNGPMSSENELQNNRMCNRLEDADYAVYYAPFNEFTEMVKSQISIIQVEIEAHGHKTGRVIFDYRNKYCLDLTFSSSKQNFAIDSAIILRRPEQGKPNKVQRSYLNFAAFLGEDDHYVSDSGDLNDVIGIRFENYDRLRMLLNSRGTDWVGISSHPGWSFSLKIENITPEVERNLYHKTTMNHLTTLCTSEYCRQMFEEDINVLLNDMNGGQLEMTMIIPVEGPRISGTVYIGKMCIVNALPPSSRNLVWTEMRRNQECKSITRTDYAIYYAHFKDLIHIVNSELYTIRTIIKNSKKETATVTFEYKRQHYLDLVFIDWGQNFVINSTTIVQSQIHPNLKLENRRLYLGVLEKRESHFVVDVGNHKDVVGIKFQSHDRMRTHPNNNTRWFGTDYTDWRFSVGEDQDPIQENDPSQLENNSRPKIRMDAVIEDMKILCGMDADEDYRLYNYFGVINPVFCDENEPSYLWASIKRSSDVGRPPMPRLITTVEEGSEELKKHEAIEIHNEVKQFHDTGRNIPSLTYLRGDDFFQPLENQLEAITSLLADSCKRVPKNNVHNIDIVISTSIFSVEIKCGDDLIRLSDQYRTQDEENNVVILKGSLPMLLKYDRTRRQYKADAEFQRTYDKSWTAKVGVSADMEAAKSRRRLGNSAVQRHNFELFICLSELEEDIILLSKMVECQGKGKNVCKRGGGKVVSVRFHDMTLVKATYKCITKDEGVGPTPVMVQIDSPHLQEADRSVAKDYFNRGDELVSEEADAFEKILIPMKTKKSFERSHYSRQYYDLHVIQSLMKTVASDLQKRLVQIIKTHEGDNPDKSVVRINFILKRKFRRSFLFPTTFDPQKKVYGMDGLTILYTVEDDDGVRAVRKVYKQLVSFLVDESCFTPDAGIFRTTVAVALEPYDDTKEKDYPSIKIPGSDWTILILVNPVSDSKKTEPSKFNSKKYKFPGFYKKI